LRFSSVYHKEMELIWQNLMLSLRWVFALAWGKYDHFHFVRIKLSMIDCHTHLADASFDEDREAVMERAADVGVQAMVVVGQDAEENQGVLALTQAKPQLLAFLGFHPDRYADHKPLVEENQIEAILSQVKDNKEVICGIGEVGLDYWVCQEPARREAQREGFAQFVTLAKELSLPLNVHSRSAGHYTIDFLLEANAKRVLMHAFDGKASHALRGAEAGFLFSIPPSIVRSEQKQKLVARLPLESLALETDSPVLGPRKDERNEPANVEISAQTIAEIKGVPLEEVVEVTSANASRLFGL